MINLFASHAELVSASGFRNKFGMTFPSFVRGYHSVRGKKGVG
ncbi:MAG: hypothetical protein V4547_19140 [Bacteroidota bacterium]